MRICAVTSYLPFPLDTGDSLRIFGLLDAMSREHDVLAACVVRPTTTNRDVEDLSDRLPDSEIRTFSLAPFAGGMAPKFRARRALMALLTGTPPQVFTPFSQDLMHFLQMTSDDFDVVVLIGEPAGFYARGLRQSRARVVWDKANVLYSSFSMAQKSGSKFSARAWAGINRPFAYAFEARVIRSCAAVWVTSIEERKRLSLHYGIDDAAIIPSVAVERVVEHVEIDCAGRDIVWLSSFAYPPNWDGLTSFIEQTSPRFVELGWTLRVIGKGATASQQRWLAQFSFVDYVGYVEELSSACQNVRAGVVPVWFGAGVKLKSITLMSMGIPIASTKQGMEGIPHSCAIAVDDSALNLLAAIERMTPEDVARVRMRAGQYLSEEGSAASMRRQVASALSLLAGTRSD